MKKLLITLIATVIVNLTSQARYLTVNNNVGSVAMFTDIQLAIDSAKVGDTVFVMAGSYSTDFTIKKRILLLGEGYASTILSAQVTIDSISGQLNQVAGLVVNGISFNNNFNQNLNIKNTVFKNCQFRAIITLRSDYTSFINCLFNNGGSGYLSVSRNVTGCLFYNNVFYDYAISGGGVTTPLTSAIFTNNIWFASTSYGYFHNPYGVSVNGVFTNNIFVTNTTLLSTGSTGNIFSRNLTAGTDLPSNNQNNISAGSVFVEDFTQTNSNNIIQYTFNQLSNSPSKNYGNDGKDIGIYGGQYPWPNKKGDPGLPKASNLVVQNSVLDPNGTLKFNFKAKSSTVK